MLDELVVHNAGVIASATLEPGAGFTVITGETGAGKTLLIGALRLLTGQQARRDMIGPASEELVVEGRFVVDGDELVARRRVAAGGRSRAYLDGGMVPVKALAHGIAPLVELVAQNDALRLVKPPGARALIDASLDDDGAVVKQEYGSLIAELGRLEERQGLLGGDRRSLERELDMARFQVAEIDEAGFEPGDDERLLDRAEVVRNAAAIAEQLDAMALALDEEGGAGDALAVALGHAVRLGKLDSGSAWMAGQLEEAAAILAEAVADVRRRATELPDDMAELNGVEQRLGLLRQLQRKYGERLDDVVAYREATARRVDELEETLGDADAITEQIEKLRLRVAEAGDQLRAVREAAAADLAVAAVRHLRDLGFAHPVLEFDVQPAPATPSGCDRIELRFASDRQIAPGPLTTTASGGELSRVVLALRLAAGAADAPVVAFDEVDAGVGGATALAMGRKLRALAADAQVLCVTHLPQVAAFAERHYVVARSDAVATLELVDGEARLEELARMLAGLPDSEKGREHAAELLDLAST